MPHDLRAAIVPYIPAERVCIEHRLGRFQRIRARRDRLKDHRRPHLLVYRLAEQASIAAGQLAAIELDHQPASHVVGADRESTGGRGATPQIVALVEASLLTDAA